ncbi:T9SS type A sorting domain-containing protein [Chryseobacterium lacus]|nr:T9SS C-terminal target domain-containing protein [Chryseobacterium lacus]
MRFTVLKPGTYFIKFLSGNKWKTEKFIKKQSSLLSQGGIF